MLQGAAGAEERHTSFATAVGMWASAVNVTILTTQKFTGAASYMCNYLATGTKLETFGASRSKGLWSFAHRQPVVWSTGTFRYLFFLGVTNGGIGRYFGIIKGADTSHYKFALFSDTGGTVLASASVECATALWNLCKVEWNNGVWTIWYLPSGGSWQSFTYTDTGSVMSTQAMSLNATTNENGVGYGNQQLDDCLFWDDQGDNWNTRIAATANFPRVSAAHMPVSPDSTTPDEYTKLDEMPAARATFGSANAAVSTTTGPPGTLTDTRVAWGTNYWAGYYVYCGNYPVTSKWMKIASNDATTLTGTSGWSGGGNPGNGYAWQIIDASGVSDANYWADHENLKTTPQDYTLETIQAVMVTRVDGSYSDQQAEFDRFNVRENGVVYANSEEGGVMVQFGTNGLGSQCYWTIAGYYPWTPGKHKWIAGTGSPGCFNDCDFGCHILEGHTDQITAQVIYFGTAHEWPPPVAAPRRIFITGYA